MTVDVITAEYFRNEVRSLFKSDTEKYIGDSNAFMRDLSERIKDKLNEFPILNDGKLKDLGQEVQLVRFVCMIHSDLRGDMRIFSYTKKDSPDSPQCAMFGAHGEDVLCNGPYSTATLHGFERNVEAESVIYRKCYNVVMLPGMTDWYRREKYGQDVLIEDLHDVAETHFCAGFFDTASHSFAVNTAYEVFAVLSPAVAHSLNSEYPHFKYPQLDVISYAPVGSDVCNRSILIKSPAVGKYMMNLVTFFKDFVGPKTNALLLISALCSSRSVTPGSKHVQTRALPLNITDVKESKPIIEAVKFLMPRVRVVSASDMLSCDFSGNFNKVACDGFSTPLQLAPGTVLIIDETDAPKGLIKNARAKRNFGVLRNLIYRQELIYRNCFGTENISMDVTIILLSRHRSFITPTPFSFSKSHCFINSSNYDEYLSSCEQNAGLVSDMRNHLLYSRCLAPRVSLSPSFCPLVSAFFNRLNVTSQGASLAVLYYNICLSRILAALHYSEEVEKKFFTLAYHILSHHPIKWVGGSSTFTVNLS